MYNVLDICRYVINYSNDRGYGITNLKLQKVLYFVQAYFLITTSKQCFKERIEAWDFGPVVPEAYREYKQFGSSNIPSVSYYVEVNSKDFWNSKVKTYRKEVISNRDQNRIDAVVDRLSDYSATDLVEITHNQTPWMDAYVPYRNNEITPQAIKEYFNG